MKEETRQRKKQKQKQRLESIRRSTMMIGIDNVEDLDKLLDLLKQDTRPLREILAGFDSAFPLALRVPLCNSLHLALEVWGVSVGVPVEFVLKLFPIKVFRG
ncbi:hypothetical protein NL676_009223 [Syzygium grande]|nr:hypothetical protein NL676_009223 [Syzygium grande]